MGKSVIINQDKLLMLKENVASNDNVASHEDICVNEAAPEVDEYTIGVEEDSPVGGAYYHVNESTNFDTSEIGGVNYSWDFDEEEYQEWLADYEYENTQESLMEYINDNVEFELEYLDNETFHECGRDYVDYNTLEGMFGSRIQNEILTTCMNNGSGSFETIEMFSDDDVDINNQNSVNDIAMKLLRHGDYFKDCRGFILTNGVVVYTESEHNEICKIPNVNNKFDFIRMGNIRVLSQSIDIGAEPTSEQRDVLRRVIASYSDEELYLDIYQGKSCIGVRYIRPQWRYVMGEIDRYFSEGIKPQGNDFYENKKPKKQIVENKYDELYNKASSDFMNFMKQGALKYGDNSWYNEQYMKFKHPEIKVDPKDIKIYKALEKKDREIFKLWNEEDDREEEESKKNIEYYDVIPLAVERYGITSSLSQAGYILPDGNLLSFGQDGYRDVDHRNIEGIYKENNIPIWNDEYRYNYVVDFMNHGAIRCDVSTGILDMTQEPTSEQYYVIKSFVRKSADIDIDFTDNKGNTLHSVSYSNARPQQVVADIQRYYNEGIKPQGNMQYEGKKRKSVMMSESQIKLLMEGYRKNIPQEFIDMAVKFRKNKYTNWCVVDLVSVHRFPRYFEKKEVAVRYMKILRQFGDKPALINLDALNGINENVDFLTSNLITESQESKSISAAKKLVMQRLGYDEQEADEFIRIKLRNDIPSLRTPQGGKFILGVTRMFCDGELRSANDIGNLNSTLKLVASDAHINEYDRNLNGMSCQELIQRFAKAMSDNLEAEKDEIGQMTFNSPSNYEIVRIDSFEQAEEYGDYVSWCVTHDESMFDSYTSNGINQFYFCLKNGFENVEKVQSEGCPLDEYGLSMIAVSVNENGMLNTCTCRWNHDNGGDDSIMDAKEISQVIGMNFFEVFKPNNKWKELIANVMQRLANGEDPRDVFDYVGDFNNGFAVVCLNDKYNFINKEGRLLHDQWFDGIGDFHEGFAKIRLNGKYNYLNQEGRVISDQWFDYACPFCDDFARVKLDGKYNFINKEGRVISNQWFDCAFNFKEGFAKVELNGKYNFINKEGRFLSKQWFDSVGDFNDGFGKVRLNGKWNLINKECRFLSNQWFDYAYGFREGFALVKLDGKYNFINKEGRVLSNQWFDYANAFCEGFAEVELNGKWCEIDTNGKLYEGKKISTKKIYINESKLPLLTEADSRLKAVSRTMAQAFNGVVDLNAPVPSGNYYVNGNPNTTWKEYLLFHLRHEFGLMGNSDVKYLPLTARLAYSNEVGFDKGSNNEAEIKTLKRIIDKFKKNDELFLQVNANPSITFNSLKNQFKDEFDAENARDTEAANSIQGGVSDYDIIEVKDFKTANKYGDQSCPSSKLCYTKDEELWHSFKGRKGQNRAYVCLKHGWENVLPKPTEGNPYDEYGLSMIFVFIDPDGNIAKSNCRWNHRVVGKYVGDVDHAFTKSMLAKVVNVPFDSVFKPYPSEYLKKIGYVSFKEAEERLANGEDPRKIFNYVSSFKEGFAWVKLNGKFNFINQEGKLLSKQGFDFACPFINGFAMVRLNGKYNFINKEGRAISNQWFDDAYVFKNGFAMVKLDGKWNYINQEGRIISNQWFDDTFDFYDNGFAHVKLDGKLYKIDINGKLYEGKNQRKSIIISENQLKSIKENLDLEVDSSEIDLSSFKKKDELVPSIWDEDDKLNSKIRLKLLDIADDFWDFVNLKWVKPKGVILTGSICNFNWSKYSDIDLHIIADFNEIDEKTEFVKDYLDSKKNEWNNEHNSLEIMGYKVELYVQDLDEAPDSSGIYDLEENDWISKPDPNDIEAIGMNKYQIKEKAAKIMTIIDDMLDALGSTYDSHKIEEISDDADYLWKKVKEMRKSSLEKDGEMGAGNIVYKCMRRKGYLDKLWRLRTMCYDKSNSISEEKKAKEILKEYLEKDNNLPLYRYFKWAFTASSCEKAKDLAYECGYYVERYIDQIHYRYQEFDELLEKYDGNFDYCDDEVIEAFCEILEKNNLCDHFISLMQSIVDYYELPSWCTMDFNRIVKNEWCIHFGADSESIAREGFTGGTPEFEHLAYTDAGQQKPYAGYNFAFLIDDRNVDYNEYGDEAVIFRTSGVEVFHYGDNQNQVVFWGPNVKSFIPIHQENGDWVVYGKKGQILFRGENPSDVANWATYNLPQYRKQIMTGKNGYIPEMGKWNSETNKYEIVPYPIYRNESISKYITLLKNNLINEEFALDGNTEHNPYKDRWKAEREALKNFICNYGTVMQSKEDNKEGKLYKVFWDKGISQLIGYNYCLCVQWDEIKLKPKSVVYVRAMDKFSPNIRRNVTFDNRGLDNQAGTLDDVRY